MAEVWLARNRKRRLEQGHPWVYRSEIAEVRAQPHTGDVVVVKNHQGLEIARAFYHEQSQIALRIVTRDLSETVDRRWLRRRVAAAQDLRRRVAPEATAVRIVYGEADGVPGLIVDRYGSVAVVQILSAGMELRRDWIAPILTDVLGVTAVFERSDAPAREQEGLSARVGPLAGPCPESVEILENGVRMFVDIVHGQKTGHFLDQRENRAAIAPYVRFAADERARADLRYDPRLPENVNAGRRGARVLDCFCHTGGFGLCALAYGAAHVTAVDSSLHALETLEQNLARNGWEQRAELIEANAFDILRGFAADGRDFDVVILDPPAFAKHRSAVDAALRGYKEINLRALRLIRPGGFLLTASCSYPVTRELFTEAIAQAAADSHRTLRMIDFRGAARDHPALVAMPENEYLKFAIYQVQGDLRRSPATRAETSVGEHRDVTGLPD